RVLLAMLDHADQGRLRAGGDDLGRHCGRDPLCGRSRRADREREPRLEPVRRERARSGGVRERQRSARGRLRGERGQHGAALPRLLRDDPARGARGRRDRPERPALQLVDARPLVQLSAPGEEEFLDPWIGPADAFGSSFGPPAVSGIAGLLMSLDPSLTMYQVAGALEATAVPVAGIGGGRVDAWAAAHYLGLVPATPPAPPPATQPTVVPPSPQVQVTTGFVRRSGVVPLALAPGRLEIQLTGPAAKDCTMSVRVDGQLVVDLAAERTVSTLATTIRKGGAYPVALRCSSMNRKAYEFTATAFFAN